MHEHVQQKFENVGSLKRQQQTSKGSQKHAHSNPRLRASPNQEETGRGGGRQLEPPRVHSFRLNLRGRDQLVFSPALLGHTFFHNALRGVVAKDKLPPKTGPSTPGLPAGRARAARAQRADREERHWSQCHDEPRGSPSTSLLQKAQLWDASICMKIYNKNAKMFEA